MYKFLIKPVLFLMSPEAAHHFVFRTIRILFSIPGVAAMTRSVFVVRDQRLKRTVFGIEFPNPVGLAAGFDKDAKAYNELSCFGFGFIEIGTVTPMSQAGNEKPRMFRLPDDEALINRMGFNNEGSVAIGTRLHKVKPRVIIGGNIGKNKHTTNEDALLDYVICFRTLFDVVDYFVINVSSPNTPGLRELQERKPLTELLRKLMDLNVSLSSKEDVPLAFGRKKPVLLKIAPDLTNEQLDDIIEIVKETGIDGVVAVNTTISREGLTTSPSEIEKCGQGGLSGKPLAKRSTEVIRYLCERSCNAFPVIASGGIHTAEDAIEKINAGAVLVQVYTGFVYEGPAIAKRICKGILSSKT